jgi:FtsZ-interacting cell division protein ZipA
VNTTTLVIVAILIVLLAVVLFFLWQGRRTENLQKQFGPEYKRAVDQHGDQRKAEAELVAREKRVRKLEIRALAPAEQSRFTEAWQETQARFVDEPSQAVRDADGLVKEVMQARGYPVGDFEQRAADVSVDHPNVVINYRAAHDIAARNNSGNATTEDLRQALVHYRSLFEDLLEPTEIVTHKEAAS